MNHLFTCRFTDRSVIQQTPADVSTTDPNKSAFYDVMQRGIDDVLTFTLVGEDRHSYMIDLSDGHFEIDGVRFNAVDPRADIPHDAKRRLIFFRRNFHTVIGGQMAGSSVEYHIGYQVTVGEHNYQTTISVR